MKRSPKVAGIGKECVACGCCAAVCPRDALYIASGVTAGWMKINASAAANVQKFVRQTLFPSSNGGLRCETEKMV